MTLRLQDVIGSHVGASPASSHVGRKRTERIRRILRTAAVAFAELGYEQANLEHIAARLDMRGPSLYYYFPSKDALLMACLDHTAAEVTGRAKAVASGGGTARQRLRQLFADQVLVQARDFPEFVPLFVGLRVPNPQVREHVRALRREHGDVYRAVVDEAVAAGELAAAGTHHALLLAFGALSYLQDWYDPAGPMAPEELAHEVAARLLRLFPRVTGRRGTSARAAAATPRRDR